LNPAAPECPRWYRSKTFLLGLLGLSCLFWLWVDSAQIATHLVVASKRPRGYLGLQSGHGSVSFSIQALEPDEVQETIYMRGRHGVGVTGGQRLPARIEVRPSRGYFGIRLPVWYLWAGYVPLWSGLLLWRARRIRTRRGMAFGVDPS
jgi:hypothetical protein